MHFGMHGEREARGDSAPRRRYLSGEMLHCLTHTELLVTFYTWIVLFKGCRSIPLVSKTTQYVVWCCRNKQPLQRYIDRWSLNLPCTLPLCPSSCAPLRIKRGDNCHHLVPVFFMKLALLFKCADKVLEGCP